MRHVHSAVVGIALLVQLFLPANLGLAQASQESAKEPTGNEFLRDCTYTLRLLDGDSQLTREELSIAYHCSGYLQGFVDGYTTGVDLDKFQLGSSRPLFCLPKEGLAGDQEVGLL
jgi:hypothetical protein